MANMQVPAPKRHDGRIIIHFVSIHNLPNLSGGIVLLEILASKYHNRTTVCTVSHISRPHTNLDNKKTAFMPPSLNGKIRS